MRLRDVSPMHHRLLEGLASGISTRLEARFIELRDGLEAHIGITLHEGSRNVLIELPFTLLNQALEDPGGREVLRTRMKARRDRMMFQAPAAPLPKNIVPLFGAAGPARGGYRGGRR